MSIAQKISKRVTGRVKYIQRDILNSFGFYKSLHKSARGSRIMVYHGICLDDHTRFNTIFLKLKTFEAHLKCYKKHFNVISLDDYYQQKFSNDKFNICLTFDDGFANNYKYVLPLLEQYKIPATFFITSIRAAGFDILWNDLLGIVSKYGPKKIIYKNDFYTKNQYNKYISVNSNIPMVEKLRNGEFNEKTEMMDLMYPLVPFKAHKQNEDYWLQMTAEQIKELSKSLFVTVGAHGYYHNDLAKINVNNAVEELIFSKQYLENIIEKEVKSFAFPYGSYSNEVISAAKAAGYQQLLATDFQFAEDIHDTAMRERFTVNPFISVNNQMHATIKGSYE